MKIELTNIAKKYHRSYLFKELNYSFEQGQSYALLGPNGSGKSTLLRIICGFTAAGKGSVEWYRDGEIIDRNHYHRYFSYTSPAMELFEELTLEEQIRMHFKLKELIPGFSMDSVIEKGSFEKDRNKQLKHFSSGMMQRLKLCLALFSNSPVLLLDEPCTNMDEKGIAWYRDLVRNGIKDKLLIVASNQPSEYDFCEKVLDLTTF